MKAKELDKKFDEGKSIIEHLDLLKAKRPNQEQKRVNVDFPLWMIQSLDKEAKRLGVPRQSIIKIWLAERLHKSSTLQHSNLSLKSDLYGSMAGDKFYQGGDYETKISLKNWFDNGWLVEHQTSQEEISDWEM